MDSSLPVAPGDLSHSRRGLPRDEVFHALAESLPVPILISRQSDGEILYCNEQVAMLFGVPVSSLVGRRTADLYHEPNGRAAVLAELEKHGRVRDLEVRYKTHSGRTIWTVINIEPREICGEQLLLGCFLDVTRRKEIEASLQESEGRFRGFVENAIELVFALDRQSLFTYVSPNVTRLLGHAPEQLLRHGFEALVHADDLPRLWESTEQAKETRASQSIVELRLRHRDGSTRWFSSTLSPLLDEHSNVVGLTGTAHEITREKHNIAELEAANQSLRDAQLRLLEREKLASLGMLLDGIAHEIRTPISAVCSTQCTLTQALDKLVTEIGDHHPEISSEPKLARLIGVLSDATRVIGDGSSRVMEIVKRLRRFACPEQRRPCCVDVNTLVEDTLALIARELGPCIAIRKRLGEGVSLLGYPGRLNQVLVNLLVNAGQALRARRHGTITLETRALDAQVEIRISDDGTGIAPEHLPKIFERGFTTKACEQGSGYGLALSKEIVEEHGGRIECTSTPGMGTTFTILLPRTPPMPRCPPPCGRR
jgi:two-component system NtrC family sensor kinase